jgi:hypothetical protein
MPKNVLPLTVTLPVRMRWATRSARSVSALLTSPESP